MARASRVSCFDVRPSPREGNATCTFVKIYEPRTGLHWNGASDYGAIPQVERVIDKMKQGPCRPAGAPPLRRTYLHVAAGEELCGVAAVGALAVNGADLEATLWGWGCECRGGGLYSGVGCAWGGVY